MSKPLNIAYGQERVDNATVFESALKGTSSVASSRSSVPQTLQWPSAPLAAVELSDPAVLEAPHVVPAMHGTSVSKTTSKQCKAKQTI